MFLEKKKRLTDRLGAQEWVSSGCPYSLHSGASAGGQARLEEATTGKEEVQSRGPGWGLLPLSLGNAVALSSFLKAEVQ